jgi:hypothetical protein
VDLWDLEHYLTQRHKETDLKYDYRYSQLTQLFGRLLQERRLSEQELRGLREDKMKLIRSFAKILSGGRSVTWVLSANAMFRHFSDASPSGRSDNFLVAENRDRAQPKAELSLLIYAFARLLRPRRSRADQRMTKASR